jgi:signal transduction histidine kinase
MLSSLVGLGIGLGIGILLGRLSYRRRGRALNGQPVVQAAVAPEQSAAVLGDRLRTLQLDYYQATEMSQFKAGFLARTSHELRSPLNSMIGMHQLILSELYDSPEEEKEFVADANAAALRMVDVLDNLLAVARTEYGSHPLDLQPVQLVHMFQEVHLLTHLQAKNRNLRLTIAEPDADLYVLADPRSLRQVLVKLIDGAIMQMENGYIRLTVEPLVDAQSLRLILEDERPAAAWQEAIALLQSEPANHLDIPSPGLNLLAVQTLLELMGGRLELVTLASDDAPLNRLHCTLPWVKE